MTTGSVSATSFDRLRAAPRAMERINLPLRWISSRHVAGRSASAGNKGSLIEIGPTNRRFTKPEKKRTEDYLTSRFA